MVRQRARTEGGATAVEFALVMTPLLMIIFGVMQYAFYFLAMQGGADAARQAARLSAVGNPEGCADFRAAVADSVGTLSKPANTATVTRTYTKGAGNTSPDVEVGDVVDIEVSFESADFNLPFIPFIEDGVVSATAQARVDYVPAQPETCS